MKDNRRARRGFFTVWIEQHRGAARRALRGLRQHAVLHGLTIVALALLLATPAAGWLVFEAVEPGVGSASLSPRVSVYLPESQGDGGSPPDANELERHQEALRDWPEIAAVLAQTADAVWDDYRAQRGGDEVFGWIDSNPMPALLELELRRADPEPLGRVLERLHERFGAVEIQAPAREVLLIRSTLAGGQRIGTILGVAFVGIAVLLVVQLTRAQLHARRDELALGAMLGASRAWQLRPTLYAGALAGLLGGVLAWAGAALLALVALPGVAPLLTALELPAPEPLRIAAIGLPLVCGGFFVGWISALATGPFVLAATSSD